MSSAYEKQLKSINKKVFEVLEGEAISKRANAIIGVTIDYNEISGKGKQMFMVSAIGTAVVVEIQNKIEQTFDSYEFEDDLYKKLDEFIKKENYSSIEVEDMENNIAKTSILGYRVKLLVLSYYVKIGKYGKAEDILFELFEEKHHNSDIINTGMNFYYNLLSKNDDDLIKGNLPRDEVNEALVNLKKIVKQGN